MQSTKIVRITDGKPLELSELKPLPLPRVTLQFHKAFGGVYKPANPAAQIWMDMVGRRYISRKDISTAMLFTDVELEG